MDKTKECCICKKAGTISDGKISVADDSNRDLNTTLIGQCPLCNRFFCGTHAEKIPVNKPRFFFQNPKGPFILCCPFDPGIPLGKSSMKYSDLINLVR